VSTESLIAPLKLYKVVYINKALGLHLGGIRKPAKLAMKNLRWMFKEEFQNEISKGINPEEFFKKKASEVYGTEDLNEIGRKLINELVESLPIYDGDYPSLLLRYLR